MITSQQSILSGRVVLFILPPRDFRDEEFLIPARWIRKSGAHVTVASSTLLPIRGMLGSIVTPDVSIGNVHDEELDAVLLVGGVGSRALWHDTIVHRVVRDTYNARKVVSAICLAPVTLANAGLLQGKRATVYPLARSYLEWKGAICTDATVETDGNIVTASGPEAAEEFAQTVARMLAQNNYISLHTS